MVEVTEGVLIDDERVSARLQILRAAGIRVALDDFGTGWSSLSYLQKFPVDLLKLDRSFTAELGLGPGGKAIPAAVLQLRPGAVARRRRRGRGDAGSAREPPARPRLPLTRRAICLAARPEPARDFARLLADDRPVGARTPIRAAAS